MVAEAAAEADALPTIRAARTIRMLMPVIFGTYVELCMYVLEKRWQSRMLQADCEMYRPDAETTSFTRNAATTSKEEVQRFGQFGRLERWRVECDSCWRHCLLCGAADFLAKRKAKILVLLRSCATNGTLA